MPPDVLNISVQGPGVGNLSPQGALAGSHSKVWTGWFLLNLKGWDTAIPEDAQLLDQALCPLFPEIFISAAPATSGGALELPPIPCSHPGLWDSTQGNPTTLCWQPQDPTLLILCYFLSQRARFCRPHRAQGTRCPSTCGSPSPTGSSLLTLC